MHVAVPVVVPAAKVQFGKAPVAPERAKVTEPVGVVALVDEVSITVTKQMLPWLTVIVDEVQVTETEVLRLFTVRVIGAGLELSWWVASPPYVPPILWLPSAVGVYVTEQFAEPPVPVKIQLVALKMPVPTLPKATVPEGVVVKPAETSVTVAVQVVAWSTTSSAGLQLISVIVIAWAGVTIFQENSSGVGSALPAISKARTWKL